MTFPKKHLNDGETIALDMHPHWWYFAEPALSLAATIVVGIWVLTLSDGSVKDVLRPLVLVVLVGTGGWLAFRAATWQNTNFVITSQRVIFRQGLIAKRGMEIPLDRVNNVNFSQGIFERMLGAGDLLIESGGEDGQQRFTDIKDPAGVQNLLHRSRVGAWSRNPLTRSIKSSYPMIFEIAVFLAAQGADVFITGATAKGATTLPTVPNQHGITAPLVLAVSFYTLDR